MSTPEDPTHEEPTHDRTSEAGSFVSRWSRRKRRASSQTRESPPSDAGGDHAVVSAEDPAPPAPTDADMPPVESLSEDADVSGFLSTGVSEALRRRALRHLFHMPKFQLRDGLDDYDGDYRAFTPLGDVVTSDMKLQARRRLVRLGDGAGNRDERVELEDPVEPGAETIARRDADEPAGADHAPADPRHPPGGDRDGD